MILDDEKEIKNEQEEQEITPEETSTTEETTPVVEAAAETVEEVAEEAAPVVEAAVETVEEVAEEAAPVVEIAAEAAAPVQPVSKEAMAADEEEEEEVELPIFDPLLGDGLHDDFNWKMDKRGAIAYSDAERHQLLKQYENTLSNVTENESIKGRVRAISAGDVASFTITVRNSDADGTGTATHVVVTDDVPDGVEWDFGSAPCTISGGVLTCNWHSLEKGGSETVALTGATSPEVGGRLPNQAYATADNDKVEGDASEAP